MATAFKRIDGWNRKSQRLAESLGNFLVDGFHTLALFAIGGTVVWSAVFAFFGMVQQGRAGVEDILLLFIFLELGAMVGIYFKTNHMPVRFLIYVAITALTRWLIGSVNVEHGGTADATRAEDLHIIMITGSILLLAVAALVLRYASYKFPSTPRTGQSTNAAELD